jgi:hypothetical protein
MQHTVKFLPPIVEKVLIPKAQYNTLPDFLRPIVANLNHIWQITITPRKTPESGLCRVNVVAAANNRTPGLVIQAIGRTPATVPPADKDDLRPMSWYAWNKGKQTFKVMRPSDTSYSEEVTVSFE